jgi:hypothetical protein
MVVHSREIMTRSSGGATASQFRRVRALLGQGHGGNDEGYVNVDLRPEDLHAHIE